MSSFKVLIAEDESLQLNNLARMLQQASGAFEIVGLAQTGRQALDMAEELLPDLVVTDIQMPQMSGIELIEALRDQLPGTHFIIISGYSTFEYAQRAISLRVTAYLLKPVDPAELSEALEIAAADLRQQSQRYETIFSSTGDQPPRQVAETLRSYLNEHFEQDVNFNLIASNLGYSAGYLTKLFQKYFDQSPLRYLTGVRMNKAKYLLRYEPSLSIRQIGEVCGYEDQGYFSRAFRKENGMSPAEYREASQQSV